MGHCHSIPVGRLRSRGENGSSYEEPPKAVPKKPELQPNDQVTAPLTIKAGGPKDVDVPASVGAMEFTQRPAPPVMVPNTSPELPNEVMKSPSSQHEGDGQARPSSESSKISRGPNEPISDTPQRSSIPSEDSYDEKLRVELFNLLRERKEYKKAIFPEEIKRIWDPMYYRRFYTSQPWYDESWDKCNLMDDYLRIMSILVQIHFRDWKNFRRLFIDSNRRDEDLPFKKNGLKALDFLGDAFGPSFYDAQWAYCPRKIQEREEPYVWDGDEPLPWLDQPVKIGEGAFGRITRQTIAKGYLEYDNRDNRTVNPSPKAVAVKRILHEDVHQVEFSNLKALRRCLSDHTRIMVNLATLVESSEERGKIHHIVYELAAYDLNVLLTNLPINLRGKRNESASPERTNSASMWPGDLILESRNLADALHYLHDRLYNISRISLAHNDIKPDNILVFYPDSMNADVLYPVGKWKIADFGLSRVKDKHPQENKHLRAEDAVPARKTADITHRIERSASVSKTIPKRDPGRYTAPELDQKTVQKTDGRKGDLWSFGCVLSEILAYAVGLDPKLVEDFRVKLLENSSDQRFYDTKTKEVKKTFFEYLETLPNQASKDSRYFCGTEWIMSCASLVNRIVVANPKKRLGADEIRDALRDIDFRMRSEKKKLWLDTNCHDDIVVPNLVESYSPGPPNASATESPTELEQFNLETDGRSDVLEGTPKIVISPARHTFPKAKSESTSTYDRKSEIIHTYDRRRRQTAAR
ncbi:Nn.00g066420.m01.CDS01 [Neocucurbitaria sp. VM-36]